MEIDSPLFPTDTPGGMSAASDPLHSPNPDVPGRKLPMPLVPTEDSLQEIAYQHRLRKAARETKAWVDKQFDMELDAETFLPIEEPRTPSVETNDPTPVLPSTPTNSPAIQTAVRRAHWQQPPRIIRVAGGTVVVPERKSRCVAVSRNLSLPEITAIVEVAKTQRKVRCVSCGRVFLGTKNLRDHLLGDPSQL
ncbi:hypothetical protein HMN09_00135200 [Mycena chlorophos]|uniref:Uncharacterized protein n=1 Tax=Mycena chlorophos TaxID=658473 RepID=A0A8H6TRQ6_MYCCL|nr:hypothetical protein HMN09_00135200 [Mycena chlorophos]